MPDNTVDLTKFGKALAKRANKSIKRYRTQHRKNAPQFEKAPKAVFTTKAEALKSLKSPHFRNDAKVKKTTAWGLFNPKKK